MHMQIIYKHGQPYGIRDENGYLFFFREVSKFSGQEERYRQEVQESLALADYILEALKARANNSVQATGGESAASVGSLHAQAESASEGNA